MSQNLAPRYPAVPDGMRRRMGVTVGCGNPKCDMCYEPLPRHLPPETPNDREALRQQIEADARLQAWRERGVL